MKRFLPVSRVTFRPGCAWRASSSSPIAISRRRNMRCWRQTRCASMPVRASSDALLLVCCNLRRRRAVVSLIQSRLVDPSASFDSQRSWRSTCGSAGDYQGRVALPRCDGQPRTGHPLLAFTRANVIRYLGDMQAADENMKRAPGRLSPDYPDAHWAVATHSRAQPRWRAFIASVPALARVESSARIEQAHLLYALFREYDAADHRERRGRPWSAVLRPCVAGSAFDSHARSPPARCA